MAEENLKDFTTNWIVGGLLVFCLLTFAITFIYHNNSTALNDGTGNVFNQQYNNDSARLTETPSDANSLLNITANTNPEISNLGSRDSVSTSFGAKKSATNNWKSSKKLLEWVFSGDSGEILLGVIGGLLAFLSMFYIWRFIRGY